MDPISASCFSLHIQENQRAIAEEQKQDEKFSEIIVSCKSLSRYEGRTFKTLVPQILAAIIVASYHIVVGISLAYSAILIPNVDPNNTEFRAEDGIAATKAECSWIASVIVIVVPIGAITGGFFMDSIGRLNTIKMAVIPSVLGWSLIALAQNVPMIIAGRLLAGFASAWGTSPAIVYMTEIGRADLRGSLISTAPTFASLGTSTQNWVPVLLLILYVVTSMIGLLPIPWTMTAELFPIEIRGIGHSIALSVANIIMFAAVQSYWTLDGILGGTAGVQWFFAVLSITASLYVFIVLPETHNKKLSEITEYFKYNSIYICAEKQKKASSAKRKGVRMSVNRDIVRSDDQSEKLMNSV